MSILLTFSAVIFVLSFMTQRAAWSVAYVVGPLALFVLGRAQIETLLALALAFSCASAFGYGLVMLARKLTGVDGAPESGQARR